MLLQTAPWAVCLFLSHPFPRPADFSLPEAFLVRMYKKKPQTPNISPTGESTVVTPSQLS